MVSNMREEVMLLDLNQEPLEQPRDSVIGLESIFELETAHGRIEERIRQLEAVTSRARQRQMWRQTRISPQITNITAGFVADDTQNEGSRHRQSRDGALAARGTVESGKPSIGDNTDLIAKALALDTNPKKADSRTGSFFDCNICLAMARDPVLTCCGHLFCWPCFCQLSYAHSIAKECPVCKGEVTDTSLIPIYGSGYGNCSPKSNKSVSMLPPRPHAHRIEGLRQQLARRGPQSTSIGERIQQLSNLVGAMGERRRSRDLLVAQVPAERTTVIETASHQQHDSLQVSRVLQGAASVSSLSSALNTAMDSAERLVEDLEAYSNNRDVRRNHQQSPHLDIGDTSSSITAVIQPETQTSDTAAEINSDLFPSSFLRTDTIILGLEDQATDSEINSTVLSTSSRRRTNPRGSDGNDVNSSEPRRRRFR